MLLLLLLLLLLLQLLMLLLRLLLLLLLYVARHRDHKLRSLVFTIQKETITNFNINPRMSWDP